MEATIHEAPAALHHLQYVITAITFVQFIDLIWRVISLDECICRQSTETAELQQAGPLIDLYPENSPAYLNHVLHDVCHNQLEVAHKQTCRCVTFSLTAPAMQQLGHVLICKHSTVCLPAQQLPGRAIATESSLSPDFAVQDAAHWLMDQENLAQSEASWHACQEQKQRDAAEAARKEKEHRKQLLAKYHLQAVGTSAPTEPKQARQAPKNKVSKCSLVNVVC